MDKNFPLEFKMSLELEGEKRISGNDLFNLLENIMKYGSISRGRFGVGGFLSLCLGPDQGGRKRPWPAVGKQAGGRLCRWRSIP